MLGIEEAKVLKDALQVAAGLLLIRKLPLDVLGHIFGGGMNLLGADTAISNQIVMGLHHIASAMLMMMMMVMIMLIGKSHGQSQQQNENFHG
ncbi:hypothetical protein ACLKA7_009745 [Drosophila subpalustris]